MPIVSVILCVFNAEKYLLDALNSIQNQTYKKIELVIVNDGSTDSSVD
ncbi:TPA: glycosyltransferase family 2 protein, partial [Vibrio cholerae]